MLFHSSNLKVFSNFFISIASAYFMIAAVTPGFSGKNFLSEILVFLSNISLAIIYLGLSLIIEDKIHNE